jgi:acetyl esterase/lipase
MPFCTRWLVAGLCVILCHFAAAKADNPLERMTPVPKSDPVPVIDFFRPSLFSNPELNPAGTHFFASTTVDVDRREVVIYDIAARKFHGLHAPGDKDIAAVDWLGDDRLIFTILADNRYSEGLFVAPVDNLSQAYGVDYRNVDHVLGAPRSSPQQPLIWIRRCAFDNGKDAGVVQIDGLAPRFNPFDRNSNTYVNPSSVEGGTLAKIVRSYPRLKHGSTRGYLTDNSGELAYAFTTQDGRTYLHRLDGSQWLACPVDFDEIEIVSVSDQRERLLVLGPREEGRPRALRFLDAATGQLGDIVLQDEKYDLARCRVYRHPVDGRLLGLRFERDYPATVWLDPTYQKLQNKIENSLGPTGRGALVSIVGSDRAEKRFFVSVRSDRRPATYLMIDTEKGAISPVVESVAPWLDPERLRPMSFLSFKNRDGVAVDGYLTLPEGASKESPAPLVVLPHGGPWVRDSWGYDPEVQFLASRGYAVFQPNYRGSLGTQWRFPVEDLWAFRKMHDDVTDGVRKLIKSGLIDPDRIAIMGASFGGYLSISGVAHESGLYRCAVALSGVYDWAAMIAEAKRFESDGVSPGRTAVLRRFLGDPKTNGEKFDEISPVRFVSRITVPVFVAHGSADQVASIEQSRRLIAELKKSGVPCETFLQRNEGHGMADLDNRVKLYTAIEAFLRTNLAPRATPAPVTGGAP